MKNFITVTTEWGCTKGGINTFNYDLCINLKTYFKRDWEVYCVVLNASEEDVADAKNYHVNLINLEHVEYDTSGNKKDLKYFDYEKLKDKIDELIKLMPLKDTVFIGHDIISADFAILLSKKFKETGLFSIACAFHHMEYEAYYALMDKEAVVSSLTDKSISQRSFINKSDLVFGVGPKLTNSASLKRKERKIVHQFIPGLPEINLKESHAIKNGNKQNFQAITWGRVDIENDKIKQYGLAVAAFAKLIGEYNGTISFPKNSILKIIGLDSQKEKATYGRLRQIENEYGVMGSFSPLGYLKREMILNEHLLESNVSLMLSFYEGFGLVGLESIAAEVPMIISKNSGLYEFLLSEFPNIDELTHCVNIIGSNKSVYNPSDAENVKEMIWTISQDYNNCVLKISNIKTVLKSKYSWKRELKKFINKIDLPFDVESNSKKIAVQNRELHELISASRENYKKGNIIESYEIAKSGIIQYPDSPKLLARIIKCATNLGKTADAIYYLNIYKGKKQVEYYYARMLLYSSMEKPIYEEVIKSFARIKPAERNEHHFYEAGKATFFLMLQDDLVLKSKGKVGKRIPKRLNNSIELLTEGLYYADANEKSHWWIDVLLLLIYKLYKIEEKKWRVSFEEALKGLEDYIEENPRKGTAKIYKILLFMIFEKDNELATFFDSEQKFAKDHPGYSMPLDYFQTLKIRLIVLYESAPDKIAKYLKFIEEYSLLYLSYQ